MQLNAIKKSWFSLTLLSNLSLIWAIIKSIFLLPNFILSKELKRKISAIISCIAAKVIFYLNPQIQVQAQDDWSTIKHNQPCVILINHTSPFDAFFLLSRIPVQHITRIRILFKSELLKLPILGKMLEYGAHFPVYFTDDKVGKFSVDKIKQAEVLQDMKAHLENNGVLALFPEGQINRQAPNRLQTFRQGLFKLLSEIDLNKQQNKVLDMYAFVHTNLEKSWHPASNFGGCSAIINCTLTKLQFSQGDPASKAQHQMQQKLNTLYSENTSNNLTPNIFPRAIARI